MNSLVNEQLVMGAATAGSAIPISFYERLAIRRGDDADLIQKIKETVQKLSDEQTDLHRPGMLLGRIQSGKTRAFLGIIACSFDIGFDVAVVLTKGTKSLARQTLARVKEDFREFITHDEVQVFDIMSLPALTPYELNQKLILIVKKEDDNLNRLLDAFQTKYPDLQGKRVLIVDDEADLASVSFRKDKAGLVALGKISGQIDQLREMVENCAFLQVTATPYSLYLQPEEDVTHNGHFLFTPKRPKFTVILPMHSEYVGGNYYFEQSNDPASPAHYFYREVPDDEREALRSEDRRRLRVENVLREKRSNVLCRAVLTFLVGGTIRRLQSKATGNHAEKYSFLFHTELSKASHEWQETVVIAVHDALVLEGAQDTARFNELLDLAYSDLARSVQLAGNSIPTKAEVKAEVVNALIGGQLMITKVNSDKDIEQLLDDDGQLRLRTPFNIFIGGQILDRGLTIRNLIAFYYGRNPKKFQQDTVLQHSRMYGARPLLDLAVTRFYAPLHIYQIMKNIHDFDSALREAFESGAHDRGVYFIQTDAQHRVSACSPNKLMFSDVLSVRPGRRLLPTGFQTVSKTAGTRNLSKLDQAIDRLVGTKVDPVLITVQEAIELLQLAYQNLEFQDDGDNVSNAHTAALQLLSSKAVPQQLRGKVWLMTAKDRNVTRYRDEGRFSDSPDTKQQSKLAYELAEDIPVLMLLRQNGDEAKGWKNLPFWWPLVVPPRNAVTMIYAAATSPGN